MQEQGLILKGVGGFYTVMTDAGDEVVCKARGRFRAEGITPVCGDRVTIEHQQEGHAVICDIAQRRTMLVRPPVANIDQIVIVLAVTAPKPDFMLCDKLLLAASVNQIEPLIVFNKIDLTLEDSVEALAEEYSQYKTLCVSAQTAAGIEALSRELAGKVSCFAGQSAVGKSSILNTLLPMLHLPVGDLARRTERGRHTTRHAQLWPYRGGAVLDTPGFSLMEMQAYSQEQLNAAYREFGDAYKRCRFAACSHRSEPECAVKELLAQGLLHENRYQRYVELSLQLEEMRKHMYD